MTSRYSIRSLASGDEGGGSGENRKTAEENSDELPGEPNTDMLIGF